MSYKRKYQPGKVVKSMHEFTRLMEKGEAVYFNHKYMHAGFITSWPWRTVLSSIRAGRVRRVEAAKNGNE